MVFGLSSLRFWRSKQHRPRGPSPGKRVRGALLDLNPNSSGRQQEGRAGAARLDAAATGSGSSSGASARPEGRAPVQIDSIALIDKLCYDFRGREALLLHLVKSRCARAPEVLALRQRRQRQLQRQAQPSELSGRSLKRGNSVRCAGARSESCTLVHGSAGEGASRGTCEVGTQTNFHDLQRERSLRKSAEQRLAKVEQQLGAAREKILQNREMVSKAQRNLDMVESEVKRGSKDAASIQEKIDAALSASAPLLQPGRAFAAVPDFVSATRSSFPAGSSRMVIEPPTPSTTPFGSASADHSAPVEHVRMMPQQQQHAPPGMGGAVMAGAADAASYSRPINIPRPRDSPRRRLVSFDVLSVLSSLPDARSFRPGRTPGVSAMLSGLGTTPLQGERIIFRDELRNAATASTEQELRAQIAELDSKLEDITECYGAACVALHHLQRWNTNLRGALKSQQGCLLHVKGALSGRALAAARTIRVVVDADGRARPPVLAPQAGADEQLQPAANIGFIRRTSTRRGRSAYYKKMGIGFLR